MSKCPIAPLFGRSGALVSTGLVRKREPPRRTLRPRVRRGYLRKRCLVFVFGRKRGFGGRKVNRVVPVSTVRGIFRGEKESSEAPGFIRERDCPTETAMSMPWMFKSKNIQFFDNERDFDCYFLVADFDLYLGEAYILEFIKHLKDFVFQDCIGCRTADKNKHDLCRVCIYTLVSVYWNRLVQVVDQEKVYINVLQSDLWCASEMSDAFSDAEMDFPSKYFDDSTWRQTRLECSELKTYWMKKMNAFWKQEYDQGLSKFRLDMDA